MEMFSLLYSGFSQLKTKLPSGFWSRITDIQEGNARMKRSTSQVPNCCQRNKNMNETYGKATARSLQPVGGINIFNAWQFGTLWTTCWLLCQLLWVITCLLNDSGWAPWSWMTSIAVHIDNFQLSSANSSIFLMGKGRSLMACINQVMVYIWSLN